MQAKDLGRAFMGEGKAPPMKEWQAFLDEVGAHLESGQMAEIGEAVEHLSRGEDQAAFAAMSDAYAIACQRMTVGSHRVYGLHYYLSIQMKPAGRVLSSAPWGALSPAALAELTALVQPTTSGRILWDPSITRMAEVEALSNDIGRVVSQTRLFAEAALGKGNAATLLPPVAFRREKLKVTKSVAILSHAFLSFALAFPLEVGIRERADFWDIGLAPPVPEALPELFCRIIRKDLSSRHTGILSVKMGAHPVSFATVCRRILLPIRASAQSL